MNRKIKSMKEREIVMITIQGLYNTAVCYTPELEEAARKQIQTVCDQAEFAGCKIRIMPDVHAGKGCTIGTTMTIQDKIVPGMVGVDIGCGTLMSNIAFFGSACTIRMERSPRSLSELMRRMQSYAAGSMPIRLTQLTSSLGRRILSVSQRKTALAIASWRSPKQSQRAALWLMQVMVRSSV